MNRKLDEEYKLRGFRDKDWLEVLNADKRGEKAKYQDLLKKNEPIFDKDGFLFGYDPAREREKRKRE